MKLSFIVTIVAILFSLPAFTQNVGIGNTNPAEKLDVNGNINVTGTIKANGVDGTADQVLKKDANGLLVWSDMCEFKNRAVFTALGALNWTVPAGITRIRVEAWGGGGGGGYTSGGAGGGYISAVFTVTPGTIIAISNGTAGDGTTAGTGTFGGNTLVTVGAYTVTANGGGGANLAQYATGGNGNVSGGYNNYTVIKGEDGHNTVNTVFNNGSTYYETCSGGHGGNAGNTLNTAGLGSFRLYLAISPYTNLRSMSTNAGKQPGGGGGSGWEIFANSAKSSGSDGGIGMTVINY